jgi:hypothetical protein
MSRHHTTGRVQRVTREIIKAGKARDMVPANHAMTDAQVAVVLEDLIRKEHIALVWEDFKTKYLDYIKE